MYCLLAFLRYRKSEFNFTDLLMLKYCIKITENIIAVINIILFADNYKYLFFNMFCQW